MKVGVDRFGRYLILDPADEAELKNMLEAILIDHIDDDGAEHFTRREQFSGPFPLSEWDGGGAVYVDDDVEPPEAPRSVWATVYEVGVILLLATIALVLVFSNTHR